jgi:predicted ester cyclase
MRAAFPDMRFETLQMLAADEPAGHAFDVEHAHAFRLTQGKIAEHRAIRDDLTMHDQLVGRRAA